jgi:hypothetical protein
MVTARTSPAPLLEPGAPPWAQRFALRLASTFVISYPTAPLRLWSVAKADLPPAADWPGAMVYINDVNKLGVSDGTAWRDAMGGTI